MKGFMKKSAAVVLSGVMAMGLLSGCGSTKDQVDGTKTVATVDGTEIPMGILSLTARTQQASLEYMYSYYVQLGYISSIWDQVVDEETGETYGEQSVGQILEDVELMYVLKSHADDYGVTLTDEDEKAIAEAAAQFMEDNNEDTIKTLSVTEDQVKEYLELVTYRSRMHDAIIAEADTEVSDEEAQQSSFTYVEVPYDEEEETVEDAEEDSAEEEAAETEDSEDTTDTEETADSDEAEDTEETEDAEYADALTKATTLLELMKEDPSADMTEVAQSIDETLHTHTGTFDTYVSEETDEDADEDEDTSVSTSAEEYPDEMVVALREVGDGEMVDQVFSGEDAYFVTRKDLTNDEDATESKKESIISERQSAHYSEVTEQWMSDADITVNEKVLATLKITDSHTFTLKVEEAEETTEDEDTSKD